MTQAAMARITCFLMIMLTVVAPMVAEETGFVCNGSKNQQASAKCRPFSTSGGKELPGDCCVAYRAFVESAKTTEERKQLCSCIQRNARRSSTNVAYVDALPGKCGMPFIFSADPNFDCRMVN